MKQTGARRLFVPVLVIALVAAMALAGCSSAKSGSGSSGGTPGISAPNTIVEKDLKFEPSELTVKKGSTVTFDNQDNTVHNVEIDGMALGDQQPGQAVTWKAERTGDFSYSCIIHPSMRGDIKVE